MTQKNGILWMASAFALSVVTVLAFSAGDTGARTLTASVVNDADAFLAIDANPASPHNGFVTVVSGKTVVTFDGNGDAAGLGINPDSTYMFDSILRITNKGTAPVDVDVSVAGADAALCKVALTTTTTQGTEDYSADPTALTQAVGGVSYLGLQFMGTAKVAGGSVDCTITVTASR